MEPQSQNRPQIKITFQLGNLANIDFGHLYHKFEFQAMVNGGYIIRAKLFDAHYNLLNQLVENGYFKETRQRPIFVTFQILAGDDGKYPNTATRPQIAVMLSLETVGGPADIGNLEFIAIDPPSWFLNMGDASGGVYRGRVDQVMSQVIQQYAAPISAEIGRTTDSDQNRWWMMRQDPMTFLTSLMDWSASITQRRTHWLVEMDGLNIAIKEQAVFPSRQRAFYRYFADKSIDTISEIDLRADNALSIVQTKLVTAGLSAISGQYLDRITDQQERTVFVKDARTPAKQIARADSKRSFTKPPDASPPLVGWSEISAIPEIYSAGDLGSRYDDYIDGRPRGLWLNMMNALLRVKFRVLGHGEWSECRGLGVDTIFVKWTAGRRPGGEDFWWVTGNWLIYGFHHVVTRGSWMTDLYTARFDWDALAKQVGG